jgi:hypothetical protein
VAAWVRVLGRGLVGALDYPDGISDRFKYIFLSGSDKIPWSTFAAWKYVVGKWDRINFWTEIWL